MTLRGPPGSLGLEGEIGTRKQVRHYAMRCAMEGFHKAKRKPARRLVVAVPEENVGGIMR
jgi:hypothetical protein